MKQVPERAGNLEGRKNFLIPGIVKSEQNKITLQISTDSAVPAHATVPKSQPTPAVRAMASAPQKVTRIAPIVTPAPPARAANPPRSARNSNEVPATRAIKPDAGPRVTTKRGMAAPTAKLQAEANAA